MRRVVLVGEAGVVPTSALAPFIEGGAKARRATSEQVWLWLKGARRFPPPVRRKEPAGAAGTQDRNNTAAMRRRTPRPRDSAVEPLALVDRVDAVAAVLARLPPRGLERSRAR